jgi:hypothetical protein
MYACGLRIGEATTLEIRSVDRGNQVLRIIGKGDKERLVLLPQPVPSTSLGPCGGAIATHAGCFPTAAGMGRSTNACCRIPSPPPLTGRAFAAG